MKKLTILIAATAIALPMAAQAHQPGPRGPQGDITLAEVEAQSAERFANIDVNGDGQLTQDEMKAHAEARKAEWQENNDGERRGPRARRGGRGGGEGRGFDRLDADGSGTLSLAEFQSRPLAMFERADANNDRVVTEAERNQARAEFREKRAEMLGQRGQ
ncbi:EF-hand domain-containing protein [Sphingomicrobium sediminis]|uniref:EF-hand domain-containing protein n=1 Tax=Sphingomicrobium sediminis TaxID=2950949 RepID=A0A9X2J368_9SPHN|nr:hypothetical protein [Sphingomicrobium sediminis]MCM8558519.1 hypothetical protein [Sphingomicrobium sediminis]